MDTRAAIVVALAVALGAHLALGWPASLLGGVVVASAGVPWAIIVGGLTVASSWMAIVAYNAVVAPSAVAVMLTTVGAIFGGLASWAVLLLTLGIGFVLGAVGALVGRSIRRVHREWTSSKSVKAYDDDR